MKPISLILIGFVAGIIIAHIVADIVVRVINKKIDKRKVIQGDNGINIELLPCPYCGTNTQNLIEKEINGIKVFAMTCQNCGARTGYYIKPIDALFSWNTNIDREFGNN